MSRSAAVKRLMKEFMDLENDPSPDFVAYPISDTNVFEWHFTLRGPNEGGFSGGKYHGRIIFPADYPFKPPDLYFLTPNGRFELNKKICLSITGYHAETWRPAWGVRSALTAIISFFPTPGNGAIGALDYTVEERAAIAKKSLEWVCAGICDRCEGIKMKDLLTDELLSTERKKVEGADEICFAVNSASTASSANGSPVASHRNLAGTSAVQATEQSIEPEAPSGNSASLASVTIPNDSGLRKRTIAEPAISTNPPPGQPPVVAAVQAQTGPRPAAPEFPPVDPAVEQYYVRRRNIDTAILGLSGLLLYVIVRRIGLILA